MTAAETRFSFDKLPAELRNQIYELALDRDGGDPFEVQLQHNDIDVDNEDDLIVVRPSRMPSLLHLNRQIRHEALPIFYDQTQFTATFASTEAATRTVRDWLEVIGATQASKIKNLEVRFECNARFYLAHRRIDRGQIGMFRVNGRRDPSKGEMLDELKLIDNEVEYEAVRVSNCDKNQTRVFLDDEGGDQDA